METFGGDPEDGEGSSGGTGPRGIWVSFTHVFPGYRRVDQYLVSGNWLLQSFRPTLKSLLVRIFLSNGFHFFPGPEI